MRNFKRHGSTWLWSLLTRLTLNWIYREHLQEPQMGSSWSSGKEFYLVMPVLDKNAVLMLPLSIPCHWFINTSFKSCGMWCCVNWQVVAVGSASQVQAV